MFKCEILNSAHPKPALLPFVSSSPPHVLPPSSSICVRVSQQMDRNSSCEYQEWSTPGSLTCTHPVRNLTFTLPKMHKLADQSHAEWSFPKLLKLGTWGWFQPKTFATVMCFGVFELTLHALLQMATLHLKSLTQELKLWSFQNETFDAAYYQIIKCTLTRLLHYSSFGLMSL